MVTFQFQLNCMVLYNSWPVLEPIVPYTINVCNMEKCRLLKLASTTLPYQGLLVKITYCDKNFFSKIQTNKSITPDQALYWGLELGYGLIV